MNAKLPSAGCNATARVATGCELTEILWQQAQQRLGARTRLFERLRTITAYQVFPSWAALLATGGLAAQPP